MSSSLGEDCQWDITSNDNGTITMKDKASGKTLFQNGDGSLSLSDDVESGVAGSQWGVTKSKDGDLLIRSTLNGNFLMRNDKGKLVSSPSQLGDKSSWVIKSENGLFSSRQAVVGGRRSVGKALAAALAAHGGVAIVQNGSSNVRIFFFFFFFFLKLFLKFNLIYFFFFLLFSCYSNFSLSLSLL